MAKRPISVEAATRRDLAGLPAELRKGAIAMGALTLARALDDDPPGRERTMLSRELRQAVMALWDRCPPALEDDPGAEIGQRREARMTAKAAARAEPAPGG